MPEEDPNTFFMISLIIQQLYREILAVADEMGGQLPDWCVENREPGANPGRYRHCERGGYTHDESRSLGSSLRRLCASLRCVSQENC